MPVCFNFWGAKNLTPVPPLAMALQDYGADKDLWGWAITHRNSIEKKTCFQMPSIILIQQQKFSSLAGMLRYNEMENLISFIFSCGNNVLELKQFDFFYFFLWEQRTRAETVSARSILPH